MYAAFAIVLVAMAVVLITMLRRGRAFKEALCALREAEESNAAGIVAVEHARLDGVRFVTVVIRSPSDPRTTNETDGHFISSIDACRWLDRLGHSAAAYDLSDVSLRASRTNGRQVIGKL